MSRPLQLRGRVVRGVGKAAFFTRLGWFRQQCRQQLGFDPYPGTLNVQVLPECAAAVAALRNESGIPLVPPNAECCSARMLPVLVGGIRGALVLPEARVRVHGESILEIVASMRLKGALGLADGDVVALTALLPRGGMLATGVISSLESIRSNDIMIVARHNNFDAVAGPLRVEGVMFDLDGTLIDSTEVYYRIVEIALEQLGMPPVPRRRILEAAQDGEFDWKQVLPPDTKGSRKALIRKGWRVVADVYPAMFRDGVELVPGTVEIVHRLADAGLKLGIVTSTPRVNMADKVRLLASAGIFQCFEAVVASEDAPRKKPAPDPLIACGQTLGVAAEKNVYVGDTRIDILAGKAAGMRTVGVLTGFEGQEDLSSAGPDAILPSVADLGGLVAR